MVNDHFPLLNALQTVHAEHSNTENSTRFLFIAMRVSNRKMRIYRVKINQFPIHFNETYNITGLTYLV